MFIVYDVQPADVKVLPNREAVLPKSSPPVAAD